MDYIPEKWYFRCGIQRHKPRKRRRLSAATAVAKDIIHLIVSGARCSDPDKYDLIESEEFGYCSLMRRTSTG